MAGSGRVLGLGLATRVCLGFLGFKGAFKGLIRDCLGLLRVVQGSFRCCFGVVWIYFIIKHRLSPCLENFDCFVQLSLVSLAQD